MSATSVCRFICFPFIDHSPNFSLMRFTLFYAGLQFHGEEHLNSMLSWLNHVLHLHFISQYVSYRVITTSVGWCSLQRILQMSSAWSYLHLLPQVHGHGWALLLTADRRGRTDENHDLHSLWFARSVLWVRPKVPRNNAGSAIRCQTHRQVALQKVQDGLVLMQPS